MKKLKKAKVVKLDSLKSLIQEFKDIRQQEKELKKRLDVVKKEILAEMRKRKVNEIEDIVLIERETWEFNGKAVELLEGKGFEDLVEKKVSTKVRQVWDMLVEAIPQLKYQRKRYVTYYLKVKEEK